MRMNNKMKNKNEAKSYSNRFGLPHSYILYGLGSAKLHIIKTMSTYIHTYISHTHEPTQILLKNTWIPNNNLIASKVKHTLLHVAILKIHLYSIEYSAWNCVAVAVIVHCYTDCVLSVLGWEVGEQHSTQ